MPKKVKAPAPVDPTEVTSDGDLDTEQGDVVVKSGDIAELVPEEKEGWIGKHTMEGVPPIQH